MQNHFCTVAAILAGAVLSLCLSVGADRGFISAINRIARAYHELGIFP